MAHGSLLETAVYQRPTCSLRVESAHASMPAETSRAVLYRCWQASTPLLARDAQAKLALIVAQIYLSVHPSVCPRQLVTRMHAASRVASHLDYRLVSICSGQGCGLGLDVSVSAHKVSCTFLVLDLFDDPSTNQHQIESKATSMFIRLTV